MLVASNQCYLIQYYTVISFTAHHQPLPSALSKQQNDRLIIEREQCHIFLLFTVVQQVCFDYRCICTYLFLQHESKLLHDVLAQDDREELVERDVLNLCNYDTPRLLPNSYIVILGQREQKCKERFESL